MSFSFPLRRRNKRTHHEALERSSPILKRRTYLNYLSYCSQDFPRPLEPRLEDDVEIELKDRHFTDQLQDVILDEPRTDNFDDIVKEYETSPSHKRPPSGTSRAADSLSRIISRVPYCTVPSEDLDDNFYYNLLAWSSTDILAIGLSNHVYLRNSKTEEITFFLELTCGRYPTSLCWSPNGNHLSIGLSNGEVFVYDTTKVQLISSYREHHGRVCSLSWSRESLASGSADTQIILKDFRCRGTGYRKLEDHPTEVCGLRWCPDGILLASGSLSEEVLVWDRRSRAPYSKLGGHKAAVKALAWNPRSTGILATGTGLSDKLMRVWDVETSQQLHAIDTGSQITGLEWSPSGTEIVSSHGFQANELVVWRYPSLNQIVKLSAHANRLAYMVRSSDGTCVVTGSGHEKICYWKLFPSYVPPTSHPSKSPSPSMLFHRHTIR